MSEPNHDSDEIFDEMQRLDDIEADLADTALAFVSFEDQAQGTASSAEQTAMEQSAQVMENVLEQSIPDAPVPITNAETTTESVDASGQALAGDIITDPLPSLPSGDFDNSDPVADNNNQAAPASAAEPVAISSAVEDVQEAIHAVQADVDVPILPPSISPTPVTAQDGPIDSQVQSIPDSSSATEPATAEPVGQVEPPVVDPASSAQVSPPIVAAPTDSHALPPRPEPMQAVPTHLEPQPVVAEIDPPSGLTASSPSVAQNPSWVQAWSRDPFDPRPRLELFNWSVQKSEIIDARIWYDLLAKDEPTAVQPLLSLINLELALTNFSQVEALFARALRGPSGGITAAADVSIWKAYLHYIRRQNSVTEANADAVRETITKAYEFALKECGTDRESGEIWQEYITFVAEPTPKNAWDTQAQVDNLRKLYQRAVCIPLNNVEALWKAYDAFESSNNKATAKKFLAEKSPAYMTARGALREIRNLLDSLPRPVLPPRPTFSDADRAMVNAWKAYLKWEESNPLVIEDEEIRSARIGYALRKCLGEMRHFPELWHQAATHYTTQGKNDKAAEVLGAGTEACPSSPLLTFAVAEIEEGRNNFARCHEVFEGLINKLDPEIEVLKKKIEVEVENAKGPEIPQPQSGDVDMTGDSMSEVQRLVEERENRGKLVAERRGKDVNDLAAAIGVVWVMYMRFARRAEGTKSARAVFTKARKTPHPTWHIFEASAMMEYHANKDSAVAIRIFELGLKIFADDVEYVVRYLQFLLSINDDTNARALFERSTAKIPSDKARPLWDAWARYEYMFGDLSGVHKLEARFAEVFPNDSPLKRFAQRFAYNGLDQIALRDLGFGRRQPPQMPPPMPQINSSIPPPVQAGILPQRPLSPIPVKRPLPRESPQPVRPPSPMYKRPRAQSPQGRRFTPPRAERGPSSQPPPPPRDFRDRNSRDRSPIGGYRRDGGSIPPQNYGPGGYGPPPPGPGPMVVPPPSNGYRAPSASYGGPELPYALTRFIGSLPSEKYFDGPVFGAPEIIALFGNVSRNGTALSSGPGGPGGPAGPGGYGPPGGGHGGAPPPPQQGRAGYGDPRGYPPPRRY